jgi:two-component system, OmpR family, sensor kinase
VSVARAPEQLIVRRARLRIALMVGSSIGALLALAGGISYGVLLHSQESQIQRELAWGAKYGATQGPPGCSWIFVSERGLTDTGANLPPRGFPLKSAIDTVALTRVPESTRITRNGTSYYVRTQARGDGIVQVVFDARFQLADRRHLLLAFALAAGVAILAAMLTGIVVARRAVAPLADALCRQRRFVADASHELRTPIVQVHTRAQLLARRAGKDAPAADRRDLELLVGTTHRLGEIVDELLLSARLAAGAADLRPAAPIDLTSLTTDEVGIETERAEAQAVRVVLSTPDSPLFVAGIESALRRMVSELLGNALTHTPAGGQIQVTVRARDRDRVELIVADTGDGFDSADAERLFDRFHRGPGAGDRRFGLGLALLRELVTSHGGTIRAESSPGEGACFTVRLRRIEPFSGAKGKETERSEATATRKTALVSG